MIQDGLYVVVDHAILFASASKKTLNVSTKLPRGKVVLYLNENVGTMSLVVTNEGIVGYVDYRFLSNIC